LNKIVDSPVDKDTSEECDQPQKDQKFQWLFKEQTIIEDAPQFYEPLDVDSKGKEKGHQDRYWNQVEEEKSVPSCPLFLSLEGKNERKMEKEERSEDQSYKDHLHPENSMNGIDATDHDDLAHVPCSKGKDKAGKESVSHILGLAGEDNQAKGKVYSKGNRTRER